MAEDTAGTVGARIRRARERAGITRPVLADRIGMSTEWVKAVETGRLQTPKLNRLAAIAAALDLTDVADLVGELSHSVAVFAGPRHSALSTVQAALTDYRITLAPTQPVSVPHLEHRLRAGWHTRHSSPDHRTQLGILLPDLIRDGQRAARTLSGARRVGCWPVSIS